MSPKKCLNAKKPKVTYPELVDKPLLHVLELPARIGGVAIVRPSHVAGTTNTREIDNPREILSQ